MRLDDSIKLAALKIETTGQCQGSAIFGVEGHQTAFYSRNLRESPLTPIIFDNPYNITFCYNFIG